MEKSPLAPEAFPSLPAIAGLRIGATSCGIRYRGRRDLFLAALEKGATVAGVFTRSATRAAPVTWCQKILPRGRIRAIVVNAGTANAFTGKAGMESVRRTAAEAARVLGCGARDVFIASTGVIGGLLPDEKIVAALPELAGNLGERDWEAAASAICTTDTFPKAATRTAVIDGVKVQLAGIAKGSGMIAPNMATMLGFVFTDAKIPADVLQVALSRANARSFNSITVDSDTSTNDTVLLAATGQGPKHRKIVKASDRHFRDFREKLEELLVELAHLIVRDGEGATKFVTVSVTGAASEAAARRLGLAIANSPLVKTAIAGEDANWGRIVMAIGKSGERCDQKKLKIAIGGVPVAAKGAVLPDYDETPVARHMKCQDIVIEVDAGVGNAAARVWTCDLTHRYISINADYRS